jgi:hypothetical protein
MIHGEIIDIQYLEYLEVKQLVSIGFHCLFNHDMVIFSVEAIVIVDSDPRVCRSRVSSNHLSVRFCWDNYWYIVVLMSFSSYLLELPLV